MELLTVDTVIIILIVLFIVVASRSLHLRTTPFKPPKWTNPDTFITFPNSLPTDSKADQTSLKDVKPYEFPPLRERTSSRMAMGLKCLDKLNWLTVDINYLPEHALRTNFLATRRPQVLQCLPGSEEACHEVLDVVTSFLITRFPQYFTVTSSLFTSPKIHNYLTGETFTVDPTCLDPLEIAARLAMEDFNVLIKDPETCEYRLQASATLFPAGWKLQERVGTSMASLHKPVPGWKEKLGGSVNRYFDHLSPKTSMERTNLFIQTTSDLFQNAPESSSLEEGGLTVEQCMVRRERQTFTRLERSGAVLFTVRTYMQPLVELGLEEMSALLSQVRGWEEEVRVYKGWGIWGPTVEKWCEEKLSESKVDDGNDS